VPKIQKRMFEGVDMISLIKIELFDTHHWWLFICWALLLAKNRTMFAHSAGLFLSPNE
jgi:hypothetical protein